MKRFIIILAILVPIGTMATILRTMVVEPDHESTLSAIPMQIGEWQGKELSISDATNQSLQATQTVLRNYYHPDGTVVSLFVAYFRDQKYGSQIHSPRHCVPGGGWVVSELYHVPFDLGAKTATVNRMRISRKNFSQQMYYWFITRSGELTSEYALKLDLVKNSLLLSPTDAAMIRLTITQQGRSVAECQKVAEEFVQGCIKDIERTLPFNK